MTLICYESGTPELTGVYACRVPYNGVDKDSGLLEDIFLTWFEEAWWYMSSDAKYRGEVLGWVGPLQRKMESKNEHSQSAAY